MIRNSTEGTEKRQDTAVQKAVCEVLEQLQELECPMSITDRDTFLILQLEATDKAAMQKKQNKPHQRNKQKRNKNKKPKPNKKQNKLRVF